MRSASILLYYCLHISFQGYVSLTVCPPSFPSSSTIMEVSSQCTGDQGNCKVLTEALLDLDSSSVLNLTRGTHSISRYVPITNVQDVFIVGGGMDKVIVTCDEEIGLSFVNVSRLTLCGFTIKGCGLTGMPVHTIVQQLKDEIALWFGVPMNVSYALVLGNSWNVSLLDIHITETRGLGLLGINVMGDSIFQQVNFTFNIRPNCSTSPPRFPFKLEKSVYDQIGGGAYFLYQDYIAEQNREEGEIRSHSHNLLFRDAHFSHNAECSYAGITEVNFQQVPLFVTDLFLVGAGGGLSVFMAQVTFNVETLVASSTFIENDARYGAGAHISIFAGVNFCQVIFLDCLFERNGAAVMNRGVPGDSELVGGGGLAVFTDLLSPSNLNQSVSIPVNISILVSVTSTNFTSNVASVEGGGMMVYSLFTTPHRSLALYLPATIIVLNNSVFWNNSAQYGAAAFLQQNSNQGVTGSIILLLLDVTFSGSKANKNTNDFNLRHDMTKVTSALAFRNIFIAIWGTVVCSDNEVTGLFLHSSPVFMTVRSRFLVERNSGQQGGGIHMEGEGTTIAMSDSAFLSMRDNTATLLGGAIYVSPSIVSNDVLRPNSGCFLFISPSSDCLLDDCFNLTESNVSIQFAGNSAPRGSVVYGSTLEACTWTYSLRKSAMGRSLYQFFFEEVENIQIDVEPNSPAVVSTPPALISVLVPQNSTYDHDHLDVFPGQSVELIVTVLDQFGHVISGTTTSQIIDQSVRATATLGSGGFFFSENGANTAVLTVNGSENQVFPVFFTELSTFVSTNLTVSILPCFQGYIFDNKTMSCQCVKTFLSRGVSCNLNNFTLTSPNGIWIGALTANASTEDLVIDYCYLGYCNDGDKSFWPPDYDSQCRTGFNRTGVLCGGCLPTYSVILGRTECRQCSNFSLFLIPIFGLLGILLLVAIAFLEVTVEKGWMYTILLYCNLVTLTPLSSVLSSNWDYIYVPAYLLSFELGIGHCLYDGMTALDRTFLKLLFPLYLFILMLIISLLSRKATLNRHFSPVKTFVTLGHMSYTSILNTCVEIVTATTLTTVGGLSQVRWVQDPNIVYFSGLHCALVILGCTIFVIYLIPVPLILLSPYVAFRLKKLVPFLDALWAPFESKYRFWLGVRLILRSLLFFGSSFFPSAIGNFISVLVLLVVIEVQLVIQPFKVKWVNVVDSIALGSIVAIIIGVFFFEAKDSVQETPKMLYFLATILFGYCVITCILVYHFSTKYELKRKLKERLASIKRKEKVTQTEVVMAALTPAVDEVPINALIVTERNNPTRTSVRVNILPESTNLSPSPMRRADFSRLRESLLEHN